MSMEAQFYGITNCPEAGDRIFIDDSGSMRSAKVDSSEDRQLIEFTFDNDGTAWSLVAVLPTGFNPLIFNVA